MYIKKLTAFLLSILMMGSVAAIPGSADEIATFDEAVSESSALQENPNDLSDLESLLNADHSENKKKLPEVSAEVFGDFEYTIDTSVDEITITKYIGSEVAVEIPSEIEGYPVVGIGGSAFENSPKLKSVTIPDGIVSVGNSAFAGCDRLETADLPDSVEFIGRAAFERCKKLASFRYPKNWKNAGYGEGVIFRDCESITSITVPEGVKSIPDFAFDGSNYLTSVELPSTLTSIGQWSFRNCPNVKEFQIPDSVMSIGNEAFRYCSGIKTVTLPSSLETIGNSAFEDCTKLEQAVIPNGLISVGSWLFYNCEKLETADLPDSVEVIGKGAFGNCKSLTSFHYPTNWEKVEGGEGKILENCENITSVTVPEGIKAIPDYAFDQSNYLTEVKLPSTVTKLGHRAFSYCTSLETITIPDSVKTISSEVFRGCSNLKTVTLPDSLKAIESSSFEDCKKLEFVNFPSKLVSIGQSAFRNCEKLESADLPDSVETIERVAFENCTALSSFRYPKNWKNAGSGGEGAIFRNCESLTSVTIPEGIKTIPEFAFDQANYLTSVNLPSTLTKVSRRSLSHCTSLKEINLPDSITAIEDEAFRGAGLKKVTIPASVEKIGTSVFEDCKLLERAEFSESLKSVGQWLFYNCEKLEVADLPDSVETIGKGAFVNCKRLTSFHYPTNWEKVEGGEGKILENCENITSVTVPEGIKAIPDYAFDQSNYLIKVKLPSTVTKLGHRAFSYCTSLETITIPDSVKTISSEVFRGCSNLKTVTLPDSLKAIESSSFEDCKKLESVSFPSKLVSIGQSAFRNCEKLESADLPDSVETIERVAFENCTTLSSFNYPKNWKNAGNGGEGAIFRNCESLTSVTVPEGIKTIPNYAFDQAKYLTSVDLPSTLKTIGERAFRSCERLREITVPKTIETVDRSAFESCPLLTIYCPKYINPVIGFIDNKINVVSNDDQRIDGTKVLDVSQSSFDLRSGSRISVTCSYSVKSSVYSNASDLSVTIYIPDGAYLSQNSLYLDSKLCTELSEDDNHVTIPVSKKSGKISFTLETESDCRLQTYTILNYRLGSSSDYDIIDIINEDYEILTLNAEDIVSSTSIEVSGMAPESKDIDIYVDDKLYTSVQANKAGSYSAVLNLGSLAEDSLIRLRAEMTDKNGTTVSAEKIVRYSEFAPELTAFTMEYNGVTYDLFSGKKHNVVFVLESAHGATPFKFKVRYKNSQNIDRVYITSTRNQITKKMLAVYDEKTGEFVAQGYFDENDHDYVPGKIGVQYLRKNSYEEYYLNDLEKVYSKDLLPDILKNAENELTVDEENHKQVVITVEDGDTITYTYEKLTLDEFKNQYESSHKITRKSDNTAEGIAKDLIDYGWAVRKEGNVDTYSDFERNVSENKTIAWSYQSTNNYVEKETIEFGTSSAKKSALLRVSEGDVDRLIRLGLNYVSTDDNEYISFSGYVINYNLAKAEILSSTLSSEEKNLKLEYLNELRRLAIELTSSKLIGAYLQLIGAYSFGEYPPLILVIYTETIYVVDTDNGSDDSDNPNNPDDSKGSGTETNDNPDGSETDDTPDDTGDVRDFSTATTSFYKDSLSFAIDPSGYVYEAVTSNRVAGATVMAYWIPYDDENETFWDKPDESKSVKWDADEYSQINPLLTDADGNYAWDVPEGWWKVVVEKDGYETSESDWMTVPPPQTSVNIALGSKTAPKVESVESSETKISVTFDNYIDPKTASEIKLTDSDGNTIEYSLDYSKNELSADNYVYAKTFVLTLKNEVRKLVLTVPETVKSYCGVSVSKYEEEFKLSEAELITKVDITFDTAGLKVGDQPVFGGKTPENAPYSIDDSSREYWFEINGTGIACSSEMQYKEDFGENYKNSEEWKNTVISVFENKQYRYGIRSLKAADGYEFSETVEVYINGAKAEVYAYSPDEISFSDSGVTLDLTSAPDLNVIIGDLDGDEEVTSNDAIMALRYSIGMDDYDDSIIAIADVDDDGEITSNDAIILLRASIGMDTL